MSATSSPAFTPTTYDISLLRDGYAVVEVYANGFGRSIVERGFDLEMCAQAHIDELLASEAEEHAEQIEAEAAAKSAADDTHAGLAKAVEEFLWAADRGRFGSALRCDGEDSAYVTDLRNKLAAVMEAA